MAFLVVWISVFYKKKMSVRGEDQCFLKGKYLAADTPLLGGIVGENLERVDMGLLAKSLPHQGIMRDIRSATRGGETYPGVGLGLDARIRIGFELGVARGLLGSDVGDEAGEEITN